MHHVHCIVGCASFHRYAENSTLCAQSAVPDTHLTLGHRGNHKEAISHPHAGEVKSTPAMLD